MSIRHLGLGAVLCASIAFGQTVLSPPTVSHLEGKVYLGDKPLLECGAPVDGEVVRTAESSRLEIRLLGGALYVGESSSVRVLRNRPYNFNRVEILNGSAVLIIEGDGRASAVCEEPVMLSDGGVFRFDLRPIPNSPHSENDCAFKVYQGAASVQLTTYFVVLTSAKMMGLNRRCGDKIPVSHFNTRNIDDLDRWSAQRAIARQRWSPRGIFPRAGASDCH
jgi:hypothetical protein